MPADVYEIPEARQEIILVRPVDQRDDPVEIRRRTVPDTLAVVGSASCAILEKMTPAYGYKRLEERGELARNGTTNAERLRGLATPAVT
jgi:hypothetical protein